MWYCTLKFEGTVVLRIVKEARKVSSYIIKVYHSISDYVTLKINATFLQYRIKIANAEVVLVDHPSKLRSVYASIARTSKEEWVL